jgi:hypothetical protein
MNEKNDEWHIEENVAYNFQKMISFQPDGAHFENIYY